MHTNRHRLHRHHGIALAVIAVLDAPLLAHALPQGGQVVEGQVTIGAPAAGQLGITQGSARAVVDWRSFGIGANEWVSLAQPAGGAALFRVTGTDPSQIFGSLSATGALFLSNPNGVLFGAGARVDVGSLAATTLGMTNADFMAGRLRLAGDSRASVVNEGRIDAAPGGSVVLLGASVSNSGTINAPQGNVALGAGSAATLDVYGNGLLKLNLTAGADGARIDHAGTVTADGGTASAAAQGAASVLNIGGVVRARSLEQRGGAIYLSGGPGAKINLTGTLDASAAPGGAIGGRVDVRAEVIDVASTAVLRADAGAQGQGGTVDAIATDAMRFAGHVSARGGSAGGDGGSAEVSGHGTLAMTGSSDLRATAGQTGTLLLDPGSISIIDSAGNENGPNVFGDTQLATLLGANSVTLSTANATNGAAETITVNPNVDITWGTATTLTLNAGRNIVIGNAAVLSNTAASRTFNAIVLNANRGATATRGAFSGIAISNATLQTNDGTIALNGTGGNGDAAGAGGNHGIFLDSATLTSPSGSVLMTGQGGSSAGSSNAGIWIQGTSTIRVNNRRAISIFATGGGLAGSSGNAGLAIPVGSSVTLRGGNGGMDISATGGAGVQSHGLWNQGSLTLASGGGDVTLRGAAGGGAYGIYNDTGGLLDLPGNATFEFTLSADRMRLAGATSSTGGILRLTPESQGRPIGIGDADSAATLGLDAADLAGFAPSGRLEIGSTRTGAVTVSAAFTPAAGTGTLALVSGASINVSAPITGGAARLSLSGATGVRLAAVLSSTAANVAATRAISIRTPGSFDNAVGAAALSTPSGSWAISLSSPLGHSYNGLMSGNTAVWNTPVTSAVNPTGNRYAFAAAPTIYLNAGNTGKVYGDVLADSVSLNGSAVSSVANTFGGVFTDYQTGLVSGSYTRASTGLAATAGVGSYANTVASVAGLTTDKAGYVFAVGSPGTVTVTPRAITLSPNAVSRPYGDANPPTGAGAPSVGTLVNGDTIGSVVLSSAATDGSFVGSYPLSASRAVFSSGSALNYTIAYAIRADGLRVIPRPLSLRAETNGTAQYGGGFNSVSISQDAVLSGSLAAGDASVTVLTPTFANPASLYALDVGLYRDVTLTTIRRGLVDVTANYALSVSPGRYSIIPRPLTLSPVAATRIYGNANPAAVGFTSTAGLDFGLANGDSVASMGFTSPAALTTGVGTYASTGANAVFATGKASNYTITYAINASGLSITPRPLTLSADAVSRLYGNTTAARGTASATAGNLANGDTVTDVALATPATGGSFVGTYTLSAADAVFGIGSAANYSITYADRANGLTITPRPVTLTLGGSVIRPYGGGRTLDAIAAPTVTAGNLVVGDRLGSWGYNVGGPAPTAPVGTYATAFNSVGLVNAAAQNVTANYTITLVNAPFFVTPRPVTLTPVAVSRTYGDANPATAGASSNSGLGLGLVNGDTVSQLSITSPAAATSNVGNFASTGSNALFSTGAASNYAITYGTNAAGLVVTPRLLTVTPDAVSRLYGDANPAIATATGNNLVNGDSLASVSISSTATPASNVGAYPTDAAVALFATGLAGNYTITYASNPAGLAITPRPITLAASPVTRLYGDSTPARGAGVPTLGTLVNGDTVASVALSTPALVTSPVAGYDLNASNAVFSVGSAANYAINYLTTPVGLLVNPRPLTLSPDAVSRSYGDANPAIGSASVTAGNLVNGDAIGTLTLGSAATPASSVGSYLLDGSNLLFASGEASNYAVSIAPRAGGLTVTTRALTVTPDAVTRLYGNANPLGATATGDNLVNGDTLSGVSIASAATQADSIGTYPTTPANAQFGSGSAGNYAIAYADNAAGLAITPRPLTLTPNAATRTYGETNPVSFSAFGNAGGLVNGDSVASVTLSTSATPASNVGRYDTTGSNAFFASGLATNYTIAYATNPAGLDVTPRALTLTPVATTRLYGDANPLLGSATANAGGLVNGDSVARVSLATPAAVTSNVGVYDTTAGNALFATGFASNYAITYATNPLGLGVTARPLTVTPDAVSRLYGDANPATATARGDNLVNGDALAGVSIASGAAAASNVGTYASSAANALFSSGLASNYLINYADNANGLAITPRPLSLTPVATSRTYGDANPARGSATGNAGGLVNGDTVASVALASPAVVNSGIGRYDLTASDALFGQGSAANYLLSYAPLTNGLLITPRSVDVTALPGQAKVAGRPDPVFGFGITGGSLVAGDAFNGSLTRAAGEAIGSYPILQGTLTLGPNYTLGYTGAPFTVASTDALAVIDRNPAPGTPAAPADLLATLAPPAAGPTVADTPAVDCVREAPLGGASGARLVNRGIRLPAGVADACRAAGSPAGS